VIVHCHVGTPARERNSNRPPDASACPGDQGDPAFQFVSHGVFLPEEMRCPFPALPFNLFITIPPIGYLTICSEVVRDMATRDTEGNPLRRDRRVRHLRIVGRDESGYVYASAGIDFGMLNHPPTDKSSKVFTASSNFLLSLSSSSFVLTDEYREIFPLDPIDSLQDRLLHTDAGFL
jgi:hypothetical protein